MLFTNGFCEIKVKKKKDFSGMPQEEEDFFKLLVVSAPMVYKAFFCGIFYQIFQFKYLHMKLPSKEEWFLRFFTK